METKQNKDEFIKRRIQILEDLENAKSKKQFIETLRFYFKVNTFWKGYELKEVEE